jgi:hypothetical protein
MPIDYYKMIKGYFDDGLWNIAQVWDMVGKLKITAAQYETITGEVYDPANRPEIPTFG